MSSWCPAAVGGVSVAVVVSRDDCETFSGNVESSIDRGHSSPLCYEVFALAGGIYKSLFENQP